MTYHIEQLWKKSLVTDQEKYEAQQAAEGAAEGAVSNVQQRLYWTSWTRLAWHWKKEPIALQLEK